MSDVAGHEVNIPLSWPKMQQNFICGLSSIPGDNCTRVNKWKIEEKKCKRNQVEIPSTNINSHVQSIVLHPTAAVRLCTSVIPIPMCFQNFTSALQIRVFGADLYVAYL